jgi:predicted HTH domain antitoxin
MTTTTQIDVAYQSYIQGLAYKSNRSEEEIKAEMSRDDFLQSIEDLYSQYQMGAFSIGRFAELLGVDPFRLDYLLTALGMAVHH